MCVRPGTCFPKQTDETRLGAGGGAHHPGTPSQPAGTVGIDVMNDHAPKDRTKMAVRLSIAREGLGFHQLTTWGPDGSCVGHTCATTQRRSITDRSQQHKADVGWSGAACAPHPGPYSHTPKQAKRHPRPDPEAPPFRSGAVGRRPANAATPPPEPPDPSSQPPGDAEHCHHRPRSLPFHPPRNPEKRARIPRLEDSKRRSRGSIAF